MNKYVIKGRRCIALRAFADIEKNDIGGLVTRYSNLSQDGNCWVYNGSQVSGNACVCDNARLRGKVHLFGNAAAMGDAILEGEFCDGENVYITGTYTTCLKKEDCDCESKKHK